MDYVCRVGTPSGEVVERRFEAPDEQALRTELEQQGFYLLSLRRGLSLAGLRMQRRRVDPALVPVFAQELAALLKAGLPLFQSVDVMLERQRDPLLRQSLQTVREKVKSKMIIDPRCKRLVDGFSGGYKYKERGNSGTFTESPEKNKYSHIHDALQYVALSLFG